jgi:hypothetical protein
MFKLKISIDNEEDRILNVDVAIDEESIQYQKFIEELHKLINENLCIMRDKNI